MKRTFKTEKNYKKQLYKYVNRQLLFTFTNIFNVVFYCMIHRSSVKKSYIFWSYKLLVLLFFSSRAVFKTYTKNSSNFNVSKSFFALFLVMIAMYKIKAPHLELRLNPPTLSLDSSLISRVSFHQAFCITQPLAYAL